jgi:hypothetical protein
MKESFLFFLGVLISMLCYNVLKIFFRIDSVSGRRTLTIQRQKLHFILSKLPRVRFWAIKRIIPSRQ